MSRWWEREPGLLEKEIAAFEAAGAHVRVNGAARALHQIIVLEVDWPVEGGTLPLQVAYPDWYPYFRPEVTAPTIHLDRHQNRFNHMLCLLGGGTHAWKCDWRAADYIFAQLQKTIRSGARDADPSALDGIEGIHADPVSAQFLYMANAYVLMDGSWTIPDDARSGTMKIAYEIGAQIHGMHEFRGVVKSIEDAHHNELARWGGVIPGGFRRTLIARWVRSQDPIVEADPVKFFERLIGLDRKVAQPLYDAPDPQVQIALVGFHFLDEVAYRKLGPSWMFVLVERDRRRGSQRVAFARALRGGRGDLGERTSAVRTLKGKKIAIFGAGALGAPVAIDCARNGADEIRLIDHDFVEPGPTVRWPLGAAAYGREKPPAVKAFVEANYPWTQMTPYSDRIGGLRQTEHMDDPQDDRVARMLDGADLVFDATVELGVHHLLSDLARERGIPYVYAFGTPGMRGGVVARIRPDGPCWMCLQHALYPQEGEPAIKPPPADEADAVRPAGCTDPTFTGASFEIGEVALEALRTIVATIAGESGDYEEAPKDVSRLALRDEWGRRILPTWTAHEIPRRKGCPCCGAAPPG